MLSSGAPLRAGPEALGVEVAQGSGDYDGDGAQYGEEGLETNRGDPCAASLNDLCLVGCGWLVLDTDRHT